MEAGKMLRWPLHQDEEGLANPLLCEVEWPLETLRCKTAFTSTDDDDLEFLIVRQEEEIQVSQFLLEHFFPEVPIGKIVNMDIDKEIRPWLTEFIQSVLNASPTSIAIRRGNDRELVALAINIIERPGAPDITQFVNPIKHPLMYMNMAFLQDLSIFPDHFPASNEMFNIFMIAVSPKYANRGLASKLIELSVRLAGQLDIEMVISQAVNYYAIKALEKCGFRSVKQVLYNQFVYDGTTPLANNGIHQTAELMVLPLPF